jgi:calcineurin-like phosphoesterase
MNLEGIFFFYLELVTKVDDNGMMHGRNIDPFTIFEKLKATDFVILEKENDSTGIGVCTETFYKVWFWAWRVVCNLGAKSWSL